MISYLGKFDLPCLMTYFASYKEKTGIKINILKKAASYFTVELIKDEKLPTEKRISFRDVRSYCPPCNLDTFLTSWEAPFSKSIFPYQRYGSVEELAQATEFPTKEDFFNSLKQVFQISSCQYLIYYFRKISLTNSTMKRKPSMNEERHYRIQIQKRCAQCWIGSSTISSSTLDLWFKLWITILPNYTSCSKLIVIST